MMRPGEDDLIARYFRPLATDPGALGLGDDCATLVTPAGHDLVLKTDAVAEGIHFFDEDAWSLVARKALRVNLSDLAAKGAQPLGYLLSLALPAHWNEPQLADFARGLAEDQHLFGITLLGGDTIRSPAGLVITITVFGAVPHRRMVRRGGARIGENVYVSGTIGDAALGLKLRLDAGLADRLGLAASDRDHLLDRYLLPRPRLGLAEAVLLHANSGMDVSDGLMIDASRMARVSDLDLRLEINAVPLSSAARACVAADPGLMETILSGGDDYELLVTVAAEHAADFETAASDAGIAVTQIGRTAEKPAKDADCITSAGGCRLVDAAGNPIEISETGYRHF